MSYLLKQYSAARPLLFLMVDSGDHVTGKTGLSPSVAIGKNGGAFAAPSGVVSEIGAGWYRVAGDAGDTDTLGPLLLHATAAGADPCDERFEVVAFDPDTATNLGLSALPTAAPGANGGMLIVGTGSGAINPSGGKVPATIAIGDNADKSGYSINGVSGGMGATASVARKDIYVTGFKNGPVALYARVLKDGADIRQADAASIVYSVYLLDNDDPDARTLVEGRDAVSVEVAEVIFDTLQSDLEASNYNFKHVVPVGATPAFAVAGRNYLVEYAITPVAGEIILVRFRIEVI